MSQHPLFFLCRLSSYWVNYSADTILGDALNPAMKLPPKITIKSSPIVFIRRLIVIEFGFALITTLLALWFDFGQLYEELALARVASFNLLVGIVITSLQIFIIAVAFLSWYGDSYEVDRKTITRRRGGFIGTSTIARTDTLAEVRTNQSALGERFNYGIIVLVPVAGRRQRVLPDIPNPTHYAALIRELITPQQLEISSFRRQPIAALIAQGEGQYLEFKASFSWDYHRRRINKALNKAALKNVAAFMNTTGGILLMGVGDDGEILGLEQEMQTLGKPNIDGFENTFNMAFNKLIGVEHSEYIDLDFDQIDGKTVCRVTILPAAAPVYLTQGDKEEFFIRTGNSSQPLPLGKAVTYIQRHFET